MRTHGTLTKWNDNRGFGFITPAGGGAELFVHVSAFPRDGQRPRVGELISFETEQAPDGKSRAVRLMRPGHRARPPCPVRTRRPGNSAHGSIGTVFGLLLLLAIGYYGYTRMAAPAPVAPIPSRPAISLAPSPAYHCDGRTTCPQMNSCAEARYFLQHCPNTEMDGNHDGEPCESQWCN